MVSTSEHVEYNNYSYDDVKVYVLQIVFPNQIYYLHPKI